MKPGRSTTAPRILLSLLIVMLVTPPPCKGLAAPIKSAHPIWFPKKPCRDEWNGRDLAKFDFSKDSARTADGNVGYSKYKKRLAIAKVDRKSCYKDWTVLVYMAADNDLSPYALWDIDEMEGSFASGRYAGSTLKTDLIASVDTEGSNGIRRLHIFQREDRPYAAATSKKDYELKTPSEIASPIVDMISERGKSAVSAGARLESFLDWGVREYPAENYMVVVWGHGQGWSGGNASSGKTTRRPSPELVAMTSALSGLPQPMAGRFGGLMADPNTGESLSIPGLRNALSNVVSKTLAGRPFSVYASDACLMQMAEVAYEVAPSARYIVGSAQVQSYVGLPYRRLLYEINSGRFLSTGTSVGKDDEALLIAKMLPVLTEASLDPVHGQQGRAEPEAAKTFTTSALSSEALKNELAPALRDFSTAMKNYLFEDFFRAADLTFAMKNSPAFMGGGRELGSFLSLVEISRVAEITKTGIETRISARLAHAVSEVRRALDQTVIERRFGTAYQTTDFQFHLLGYRALGIWIPNGAAEFTERSGDFAVSSFEKETDWQLWLKQAFGK